MIFISAISQVLNATYLISNHGNFNFMAFRIVLPTVLGACQVQYSYDEGLNWTVLQLKDLANARTYLTTIVADGEYSCRISGATRLRILTSVGGTAAGHIMGKLCNSEEHLHNTNEEPTDLVDMNENIEGVRVATVDTHIESTQQSYLLKRIITLMEENNMYLKIFVG